jgi:hypothetical protein
MERIIRVASSFVEADRLDLEDIARLTPGERMLAAIQMMTGAYGDASPPRLARILRSASRSTGRIRRHRRSRGRSAR